MINLAPFRRDALTAIYWHRLVSTDQVCRLVAPTIHRRTAQQGLMALRQAGLIEGVVRQRASRIWYVTAAGAAVVEASGVVDARPYRLVSAAVVDLLQHHALDVAETGLAFVDAARAHGHDCGPLSWTPEVAHHFRDRASSTANRDVVIADAVLHYILEDDAGQRSQRTFFIELDRATMPVARLARKLRAYVRYHDYVPAQPGGDGRPSWRQRYPRFPRVLVVLAGAAEHVLDRRLADLHGHAQAMPGVAVAGDRVSVLATTLHRLHRDGPLGEIALSLLGEETGPVSLFSRPKARAV